MGRRSRTAGATESSELPETEQTAPKRRSMPGLLGWTFFGALLPGVGLIAGGRRKLGAFVLVLFLGLVGLGVYVGLTRRDQVLAMTVVPTRLLEASFAIAALAFLW